jgi:AAA domain-containing protein
MTAALPVRRAHQLDAQPEEGRWLIEGLWSAEAVGILGGEPKCCKSFLALDVAVAVASGKPCLRRFPTVHRGRVLLFAAEDSLTVVRQRLAGIAAAVDVPLEELDIHVIVAPVLRLDIEIDQRRLEETIRALRPILLVLDPFVRLHRIDENVSAEVAPLLDYLRGLQRRHHVAILLVHHARKGAAHLRAGQALRGSSELHAWGDSNLYLRRNADDVLALTIEHRAAPSAEGIDLSLQADGDALALRVRDRAEAQTPAPPTAVERVEQILSEATAPLTQRQIRDLAKVRAATVGDALATLVTDGRVTKIGTRYQRAQQE